MFVALALSTFIREAEDNDTAEPVRRFLREMRTLWGFPARIPDNDCECMEFASTKLAELIHSGLQRCTWGFIAACNLIKNGKKAGGPGEFFFGEDPPNLVVAAYAHLAMLIVNRATFKPCAGCGKLFTPKHGNQAYCETRCQERTKKAKQRATNKKAL